MKVASLEIDPLAGAARSLAEINSAVGMTNQSMAEIERSVQSAAGAFASFGSGIGAMIAELATLGGAIAEVNGHIQQMAGASQETGASRAEIVSTAASAKTLADSLLNAAAAGRTNIEVSTAITAATAQVSAAQTAASVSTRALSTGLSLLGGPIGLLNLVITAGITAWATWGRTADTEVSKMTRMKGSVEELAAAFAKLNIVQQERSIAKTTEDLAASVKDQKRGVEILVKTADSNFEVTGVNPVDLDTFKSSLRGVDTSSMSANDLAIKLHGIVDTYLKGAATGLSRDSLMDIVNTIAKAREDAEAHEALLSAYAKSKEDLKRLTGSTRASVTTPPPGLKQSAVDQFNVQYGTIQERRDAENKRWTNELGGLTPDQQKRINDHYKDPVVPPTVAEPIDYSARMRSIAFAVKTENDANTELARTNDSLYAMGAKSATEYYDAKSSLATQAAQIQVSAVEQELKVFQDLIASGKGTARERKVWAEEEALRTQALQQAQQNLLKAEQSVEAERAAYGTKQELERAAQAGQAAAAAESQAKALSDQVENYGKTKSAIAEVVAARALEDVAMAENRLQQAKERGERAENIQAIEKEIAALQNRAKSLGLVAKSTQKIEQLDKDSEEKKKLADLTAEAKKKNDEIANSLTDALMRGFESGKGFGKDLVNTLKSMFSKLVLRPILEPIAQGAAGVVTSLLGLVGPNSTGNGSSSGSGGLFDNASVIGKLFDGGSTVSFGDKVVGLLSKWTASSVGSDGIMGSVADAIATNSKAIAGFANTASSVLSYGAAAMAALDGKFGTAIGTALGTAIGTAFGFGPLGAFIGSKIGGMIDGMLSGETRAGGTYRTDESGKVQFIHGPSGGQAGAGEGVKSAMEATFTTINNTLAAIGSSLTVDAFHGAFEQSEKGRGGVMSGGQLSSGATFGESGLGSNYAGTYYEISSTQSPDIKTALANFNTDLKQVTIQALQAAIDIPEAVKALVQGVDAEALSDEAVTALLTTINTQITEVQKFRSAIMALPFKNMRDLSYDAVVSLIKLSGGLEQLSSNMTTYMEKFYSDEERAAISLNQMTVQMALLGVELPKTREGYRKIIEAQVLTTASGQLVTAAMLEMAGQFDEWVTYTETATTAVSGAHQQIVSTMKSAYSEYLTSLRDDVETARSAVQTAYNNEASALKNTISATESFIKSMADLKKSLLLGDLSTLTPEQKYAQAKSDLDTLIGLAETGDADARSEVPQAIQQFLELSRSYNASTEAYQRDFAQYLDAAERMRTTASSQLDIQKSQLDRLDSMVKGIVDVNASVQSLSGALGAYAQAVTKKDNTSLVAPPTPTGLTAIEQAINAAYLASDGRNADAEGLAFWRDAILNGADQNAILAQIAAINKASEYTGAFAEGGYTPTGLALVGEEGPELVDFRSPGRVYTSDELARVVSGGTNGNVEVVTELRATREELADQRRENKQLMSRLINLTSAASQQASREMSEQTTALRNRNSTLIPA